MKPRALLLLSALPFLGVACDDDTNAGDDAGAPAPVGFTVRVENVAPWTVLKSGTVATRAGAGTSGPLGPGEAYEVVFTAGKGQALSFATMLGESNDWFFGPGPAGIPLHDAEGRPTSGDVTAQVVLWDAGTEIDEEPAVGASTGPKQSGPDVGALDPDPGVRALGANVTLDDGSSFALPAVAAMIRVTLTPGADRSFTLRVENVSTSSTLTTSAGASAIHVSPMAWALHIQPAPFFATGEPDRGEGLEAIAESGRVADLGAALAVRSGAATPLSPGVFAVHRAGEPLYTLDAPDRGQGLERIAEDGNPAPLAAAFAAASTAAPVNAGVFATPVGEASAGPARPGQAFEIRVTAVPGDRLSLATMFGMSNDWFFATAPHGLALFDAGGAPISGDVTDAFALYDAGTEVDQELAVGPDTGPQQPSADTGAADPMRTVRVVPGAAYGAAAPMHLRVTVTAE